MLSGGGSARMNNVEFNGVETQYKLGCGTAGGEKHARSSTPHLACFDHASQLSDWLCRRITSQASIHWMSESDECGEAAHRGSRTP